MGNWLIGKSITSANNTGEIRLFRRAWIKDYTKRVRNQFRKDEQPSAGPGLLSNVPNMTDLNDWM